jgi:hypothetical protein
MNVFKTYFNKCKIIFSETDFRFIKEREKKIFLFSARWRLSRRLSQKIPLPLKITKRVVHK